MHFTPGRAFRVVCFVIVTLILLSVACHMVRLRTGHDHILGLLPLLDLNTENNLPSWFAASLLLVDAMLLLLIGMHHRASGDRFARHWMVLGFFFVLMSVDESIGLHETFTRPLRQLIELPALFYYAWIVPALGLVAGFGAAYLGFLRALPPATRRWFVASGVMYVGGAVVMEAIAGRHDRLYGHAGGDYVLLATLEEAAELLGCGLFLFALLDFIVDHRPVLSAAVGLRSRPSVALRSSRAQVTRPALPAGEVEPTFAGAATPKGWPGSVRLGLGLLSMYTVGLLLLEWETSQQDVRLLFTDIGGDTPLYGLNTTVCVGLLWGAGLLFGVMGLTSPRAAGLQRAFGFSQAMVFIYLAMDERFQLHERIGRRLGVEDAFVLGAIGLLEIALLWRPGEILSRGRRQVCLMAAAGAAFGAMVFVDAALPSSMTLRLSAEDLLKTWACALIFLFAWENCRTGILALSSQSPAVAERPGGTSARWRVSSSGGRLSRRPGALG